MSNLKISELPEFFGNPNDGFLVFNNSGQTETFKIKTNIISAAAGTSGTSGTSGASGSSGSSGTSGASGASGINGTSGSSGTSGVALDISGFTQVFDFTQLDFIPKLNSGQTQNQKIFVEDLFGNTGCTISDLTGTSLMGGNKNSTITFTGAAGDDRGQHAMLGSVNSGMNHSTGRAYGMLASIDSNINEGGENGAQAILTSQNALIERGFFHTIISSNQNCRTNNGERKAIIASSGTESQSGNVGHTAIGMAASTLNNGQQLTFISGESFASPGDQRRSIMAAGFNNIFNSQGEHCAIITSVGSDLRGSNFQRSLISSSINSFMESTAGKNSVNHTILSSEESTMSLDNCKSNVIIASTQSDLIAGDVADHNVMMGTLQCDMNFLTGSTRNMISSSANSFMTQTGTAITNNNIHGSINSKISGQTSQSLIMASNGGEIIVGNLSTSDNHIIIGSVDSDILGDGINNQNMVIIGSGGSLISNSQFSSIFGGNANRIDGTFHNGITHGTNNVISGGSNNSEVIGSDNCSVIGNSDHSSIISSSGSTINGHNGSVMLGCIERTSTRATATFVENLVVFNFAALDFADDAAAAAGGVVLGQIYHTSGAMKIRIV